MKPLKNFDEFVKSKVVRIASSDKAKSDSLAKESEQSYLFLLEVEKSLGIHDNNANTLIKNAYDCLMEAIRSKMILEGYFSSGQGAHEAEVAYLRKLNISDSDVIFANQLRYYRNGILYYGKSFDAEYCRKVIKFVKKMKDLLK
ncbi:MAG: hypothetical protein QF915_05015 [Candidatus Woesearchaeota archaeon]|jgi:hypothetical protein|nr:hypothetical protein [Candidatus Woesearchaeota archaeon]